jgi:hypothetical protein
MWFTPRSSEIRLPREYSRKKPNIIYPLARERAALKRSCIGRCHDGGMITSRFGLPRFREKTRF